tara:strand:+ start:1471 stop:2334 length:864 start_codon:yes stop_codon:yes gene_type:complete
MSENQLEVNEAAKQLDPRMDVEHLSIVFSNHYKKNSMSPEFYICYKRPGQWEIYYTEDPVKTIREFLPTCRLPFRLQKRMYYKAERANQHLIVCEVLGHYFVQNLGRIHFRGDPIKSVNLQWLLVTGFSNPRDTEEEISLLKNKQRISILKLITRSDKTIYIDLCGPQIDIHGYATGSFKEKKGQDDPILMFDKIENKKPYVPQLSKSVKVLEIEDVVPIEDEEHFGNYLEMMLDETANDPDCDKAEYLVEYHERLEEEFSKRIEQQIEEDESTKLQKVSKNFYYYK